MSGRRKAIAPPALVWYADSRPGKSAWPEQRFAERVRLDLYKTRHTKEPINRKKRRAARLAAAALALSLLTGCSALWAEQVTYPQLTLPPATTQEEQAAFPFPGVSLALQNAKEQNSDVVGWLTVPGTTLHEPVLQAADNSYYLRRGLNKKYDYAGVLFMDYRAKADPGQLSMNTVIYGHNLGSPMGMRDDPDGVQFAQLLKFTDPEFARENPYIYLTLGEKQMAFQIFAVSYAEAYTSPVQYHHASYTAGEFAQLVEDMRARSLYNYDVTVSPGDRLLTLSTCTYKYGTYWQNTDQRFVVMARLVQEGESYQPTAALTVNESPKAPSF